MVLWRRALGFLALALQAVGIAGHGFMTEPASRNVQHNSDYCPHCLNAGGPGVTHSDGSKWPNAKHGVCGDPHNAPRNHEAGGKYATPPKIAATYIQGQTVTLRVKITAPHGGRFSFGLCPVPRGATPEAERAVVTQKCIDANALTNAQDGTRYWWFGKRGNGEYSMQFKLPPAILCDRCTLQWHWESGNSCDIPSTPVQHKMSGSMVSCTQATAEEFWNCADVQILAKGSTLPPSAVAHQKRAAAPGSTTSLGNESPEVTALFRTARRQQAAALRQQAVGLPAATRQQLFQQAKALEDQAMGGAGEGFANYGHVAASAHSDWVLAVAMAVTAIAIVMATGVTVPCGTALPTSLAVAALVALAVWLSSPATQHTGQRLEAFTDVTDKDPKDSDDDDDT